MAARNNCQNRCTTILSFPVCANRVIWFFGNSQTARAARFVPLHHSSSTICKQSCASSVALHSSRPFVRSIKRGRSSCRGVWRRPCGIWPPPSDGLRGPRDFISGNSKTARPRNDGFHLDPHIMPSPHATNKTLDPSMNAKTSLGIATSLILARVEA